jgi:hypothetical protein
MQSEKTGQTLEQDPQPRADRALVVKELEAIQRFSCWRAAAILPSDHGGQCVSGENPFDAQIEVLRSMKEYVAENLLLTPIADAWQPSDYLPNLEHDDWAEQIEKLRGPARARSTMRRWSCWSPT